MLVALGVLPLATCALVTYVLLPGEEVFAPLRLALIRAAVVVAGLATVLVEVLSLARALTPAVLLAGWSVTVLVAFGAALIRYRKNPPPLKRWLPGPRVERAMLAALALLVLAELVLALASPPNNYDSQTYHLPKIEHWVV